MSTKTTRPSAAPDTGSGAAASGSLREAERPHGNHRPVRRYGSVYAAAVAGLVGTTLGYLFFPHVFFEIGAIAFFFTYVASMVARLPKLTRLKLRAHADESDTPGYVIILVTLATVVAASISLFTLLNSGGAPDQLRMYLGVVALVLGWLTIHSMLAFHYAYEYYSTDPDGELGQDGRKSHVGGLDFPGKELPDALSFLYFSFVVAMTAQVSDVTVTSNAMRRLVLLHGILSFFFNTVILAIAVNLVVSLGH